MNINLDNLYQRRKAESRSISAENPTGEKGGGGKATLDTSLTTLSSAATDLGPGWKVSPCKSMKSGETFTMMDVEGPGVIRHIWITTEHGNFRDFILRVHWDHQDQPSIECPLGDFFCQGWGKTQDIFAGPINVNPQQSMNCFLPMPFQHAQITIENRRPGADQYLFYTINYTLEDIPNDALYLHAQFRRTNPVPYQEDYVMIDNLHGSGHYIGAFMCWQQNHDGWWGEGEIKMYIDGDQQYPTICGTGTEDYFGGAWNFGSRNYSAQCFGYQNTSSPAAYTREPVPGSETAGCRHAMYRFHIHDPIFFKQDLRVTMQALGWKNPERYLPLQDDISSVVYWYQASPTGQFPPLGDRETLNQGLS